jgi:hypothetical protein
MSAGIQFSTFDEWRQRGKRFVNGEAKPTTATDHQTIDLVLALDRAEAHAIGKLVRVISAAAKKDWRAAAWWLERRCAEFSRRSAYLEKGDSARPVSVTIYALK